MLSASSVFPLQACIVSIFAIYFFVVTIWYLLLGILLESLSRAFSLSYTRFLCVEWCFEYFANPLVKSERFETIAFDEIGRGIVENARETIEWWMRQISNKILLTKSAETKNPIKYVTYINFFFFFWFIFDPSFCERDEMWFNGERKRAWVAVNYNWCDL